MENDIITLARKGDNQARHEFYKTYFGFVMGICLRYGKNKTQAGEMVEKAFLHIFERLVDFKQGASIEDWLRTEVVLFCVGYLRQNRQEYYVTTTIKMDQIKNTEAFFMEEDLDLNNLPVEEYLDALQHLPPSFRTVFNMYVLDGFDFRKISEAVETTEDNVRQNLEKARYHFQKYLQHQVHAKKNA